MEDHCSAVESILEKGRMGETYLVSSRNERENLEVVKSILTYMNKSEDLIRFVKDRPRHDEHYQLILQNLKGRHGGNQSTDLKMD